MRVLHGITGAAGQPWSISRAQRALGVDAHCIRLGDNRFEYGADQILHATDTKSMLDVIGELAPQFDVFHFYFRSFLFDSTYSFPSGWDILLLKMLGKRVVVNFRGSEVRLHSAFKARNPYHYVDENPNNLITKFPESAQQRMIDFALGVADKVIVPDPELQSYVPGSAVIPRSIDLQTWPNVGISNSMEPLIVHAPSRPIVKGTSALLKAVERLKRSGLRFRFELIENLSNTQAREMYKRADIVVDQLRIGWYGVLAVEAMALGKPVVTFVRHDLEDQLPQKLPFAIANPDTIQNVLSRLIQDRTERQRLAADAREYCCRTHDSKTVARQFIDIYHDAIEHPKPVNVAAVTELIKHQESILLRKAPENHIPISPARLIFHYPLKFLQTLRRDGLSRACKLTVVVIKAQLRAITAALKQ